MDKKIFALFLVLLAPIIAHNQEAVPDNIAVIPAPKQPVAFSHKQHADTLSLPCQQCHTNPEPGKMMGFPTEASCMSCHTSLAADKPSIITLKSYVDARQSVPWQRVYEIKAGITWNHQAHTQAGLDCQVCHGDVTQMEVMSQVKAVTAMASCITCHQAHDADSGCEACHAWPMDSFLLEIDH